MIFGKGINMKNTKLIDNKNKWQSIEFMEKWKRIRDLFFHREKNEDYSEVIYVDFKNKKVIKNEYFCKRKVA